MIAALIITFREVLEAALIVGVVLAATRGIPKARYWVAVGILGGVTGAVIVAQFAGAISDSVSGFGQEIFNASVLLLAVLMLAWHNVWMSTHGKQMAAEMRNVGDEVRTGGRPLYALAIVVGLAVMREGSETVLFLYGLAASDGGLTNALTGGAAGLAIGIVVGAALYFGLLRIPSRYLFQVTAWLIAFLAAGMAAQAMVYLSAAGVVTLGHELWDSSFLLSQNNVVGQVLHTLIGYVDRPRLLQVVVYIGTLVLIFGAMHLMSRRHRHTTTAASTRH